jgi:TPP-dependent pyruvate/acetoin dehydrogenase alpha subunit
MHLAAGQEPVAAGVCAHLRSSDAVTATHRPHHVALAHGMDMRKLAAEIFGKETGLGHGKGGHMHLFDPATNFGCSGIIAEGMPGAVGAGLAFKKLGTDSVAVSFFGEGAANQGAFHESLNLAALWTLPVVFVCEDNAWAISVPKDKATAIANNSDRAAAYGMPGVLIPDNDPVAVFEAAGEAVARARRGGGPSLIEVKTDRLFGHFEGDPQLYRTKEEMTLLGERDALKAFERRLVETAVLDGAAAQGVWDQARAEVDEAIEFARSSPYPEPESALTHVFA